MKLFFIFSITLVSIVLLLFFMCLWIIFQIQTKTNQISYIQEFFQISRPLAKCFHSYMISSFHEWQRVHPKKQFHHYLEKLSTSPTQQWQLACFSKN